MEGIYSFTEMTIGGKVTALKITLVKLLLKSTTDRLTPPFFCNPDYSSYNSY